MPASIFDNLPMPPVAKTLGWTLRVVSLGRRVALLEGELLDAEGALVARASATARVLPAASVLKPS